MRILKTEKLSQKLGENMCNTHNEYNAKYTKNSTNQSEKDPSTLLLGIYPKGIFTQVLWYTCTQMFTAALLVSRKPHCPSSGRCVNKL